MPRNISEFKGDCLMVGGGWSAHHSAREYQEIWRKPENFYTIDIDEKAEPDQIADIAHLSVIKTLNRKFSFIYFECTPETLAKVEIFKIVYQLLTEDGVFLYCGGARYIPTPISSLLNEAGFSYFLTKIDNNPYNTKSKFDQGGLSLGSKKSLTTAADIIGLPKAAQAYINFYKFFDSEPCFSFNKLLEIPLIQKDKTYRTPEELKALIRTFIETAPVGEVKSLLKEFSFLNYESPSSSTIDKEHKSLGSDLEEKEVRTSLAKILKC